MKYRLAILGAFIFFTVNVSAQVSEIKGASSSRSGRSGGGSSGGGESGGSRSSGFVAYLFIDLIGNGIAEWQRYKLTKVDVNPSVVSLEVMGHVGLQPSSYYLFHPRIRGNWGLFSTDFRVNYLLEEDIDGIKDLSTYDWQIVQLNLITTRNVIGRLGVGIMQEDFGSRQTYGETSAMLNIFSNKKIINGTAEYRWARDWATNTFPRREISAYLERQVFDKGRFHGYATLGGVYQRYYESVTVWGVQTGFILKLY